MVLLAPLLRRQRQASVNSNTGRPLVGQLQRVPWKLLPKLETDEEPILSVLVFENGSHICFWRGCIRWPYLGNHSRHIWSPANRDLSFSMSAGRNLTVRWPNLTFGTRNRCMMRCAARTTDFLFLPDNFMYRPTS